MGVVRVEAAERPASGVPADSLRSITIVGEVVSDPELSARGVEFTVSVRAVDLGAGWVEDRGKVLVFARPTSELVRTRGAPYFRYGDSLELTGRLEAPLSFGGFDYGAYLANQGIRSTMAFPQVRVLEEGGGNPVLREVYGLRRKLSGGIDEALPEPQASLGRALLLGLRGRLPADVRDEFRSTGTSHLLAISGLHVGIVLALSAAAGAWLMGRRRQVYLLLPLVAIWLYTLLSGLAPSVERAAVMGSIYLLAMALGRPRSILPALALAGGVMAGVDPQVLKQVSFQLSFTAMAGIALLSSTEPPLWRRLPGISVEGPGPWRGLLRGLALAVVVSVAATVATLPLIAFNFQRIPTLGVPTTILALPALLVATAMAAVAGLVHPQAGQVLGWVAWVPLEYLIRLASLASKVPGSTLSVPAFSGVLVWAYYGVLAVLLLLPGGPRGLWRWLVRLVAEGRDRAGRAGSPGPGLAVPIGAMVPMVGLAVLGAVLWWQVVGGTDGRLHVHFLDVGQGDSVLIVTPEGRQVLVDGGPGADAAARAVGDRTAFWDRDLDMVVLTHPNEDHFRGLVEVVDRYGVGIVLEGGGRSENPLYLEWERTLQGKEILRVTASQGQTVSLGGDTWMEVLGPPSNPMRGTGSDVNNNGVVLRLVYGGVSFLLTGDIEAGAEERLLLSGLPLRSTVLKVAHHGSRTSTTEQFLSAVSPAVAVVSAGAANPYGHPTQR